MLGASAGRSYIWGTPDDDLLVSHEGTLVAATAAVPIHRDGAAGPRRGVVGRPNAAAFLNAAHDTAKGAREAGINASDSAGRQSLVTAPNLVGCAQLVQHQ